MGEYRSFMIWLFLWRAIDSEWRWLALIFAFVELMVLIGKSEIFTAYIRGLRGK